jgi:sialate O-acetylesterase
MRWAMVLLASVCLSVGGAELSVPAFFSDGMVLQRGAKVPVWGTARPKSEVVVSISQQKKAATADDQGGWKVLLDPMDAGGPFALVIDGGEKREIQNVLVGDVWFCSGQSNMEMQVKASANAETEIAAADFPMIRHFSTKKAVGVDPQEKVEGDWKVCSPQTAGEFSAVAYYFAHELQKAAKVPIGLIHSSWGGSQAEAWIRHETLKELPEAQSIVKWWDKVMAEWPKRKAAHEAALARHRELVAEAKEMGIASTAKEPTIPGIYPGHPLQPSGLYNGMVQPFVQFPIKGVIWYQGESNSDRPIQYRKLFPALIADWRRIWNIGNFPFLFVQLAPYNAVKPEPGESQIAELRESQAGALSVEQTGMAVTVDLGNDGDIHPRNKQDVGKRLALAARAIAYGEKLEHCSPLYDSMAIEHGKIRIQFKHARDGLELRGENAKCLAIAGEDRRFVWADAVVDGDTLVVSSRSIAAPVAVRYAWADNTDGCNLFGKNGLPVVPFRTDNWRPRPSFARFDIKKSPKKDPEVHVFFANVGEDGFKEQSLTGFMLAGEDKVFHPAEAAVWFNRVVVKSSAVTAPVAVRYCFGRNEGAGNLVTNDGRAALPFRTDNWEIDSAPSAR